VSPTGPMPGVKMRAPTGAPLALETDVTSAWLGHSYDFASVRSFAEGTRRALRVLVRELTMHVDRGEQRSSVRVHFVLPKGAYATTVLSAAFTLEELKCDTRDARASAPETAPDPVPDGTDQAG
jgi:tRNA pseudouridine13 synthase